ncbi:DUF2188 domain-containing protein [Desulfosporosinus sp. SRJS8]|nr:DUF2188 domain-containing protein [Desulfosporosinus sp. SRJS8]
MKCDLTPLKAYPSRLSDGGWQVKGAGNTKATIKTDRQSEAIDIARSIARKNAKKMIGKDMDNYAK